MVLLVVGVAIVLMTLTAAAEAATHTGAALTGARYQAPDECRWVGAAEYRAALSVARDADQDLVFVSDDEDTADGETDDKDRTAEDEKQRLEEEEEKEDDDTTATSVADDDDDGTALLCRLRTINSELERTNFSVIEPRHTARLRLECSDTLFFQSSLDADSFRPLSQLRELSIEYCKIGNLSDGAFRGLRNLRSLALRTHNTDWSAMALHVSAGAFSADLGRLRSLDLGHNNMWSLPQGALCPLRALRHLNLTKNRLRDLGSLGFGAGDGQKCGGARRLLELDVSHNNVEVVRRAGELSGLRSLRRLRLEGNALSQLADRALDGLERLSSLNLGDNRLSHLPPELFADTRRLRDLRLRNNSLAVLAPGIFAELGRLRVLDVSRNHLTAEWVTAATLAGLGRLAVLDLSHNRLARLDPAAFRDLRSLQVLRLAGNALDSLAERTFGALTTLHTLVLSGNRLASLGAASLAGPMALTLLSLDNNRLATVHPSALRNCTQLRELHLNGNRLAKMPAALAHVPQLRTLDLGENRIASLDNGSLANLPLLYGLRLTDNYLTNVSRGSFDRLAALKILNLSRNRLRRVETGAFRHNVALQAVRLDGNQLTDIGGLFAELPALVWLNVSDNRLEWFDYALVPAGLQWLDLHANRIAELGNYFELEAGLALSTIDASSNRLTEVSAGAVPHAVQQLSLADNRIARVQAYTFFKRPNLTRVDLSGNRIASLDPNALRISAVPADRALPEFRVSGNPLHCDCTMEWLQRVAVTTGAVTPRTQPRLVDLDATHCRLEGARGRAIVPLLEAAPQQFLCSYRTHCGALCHCCDFDACDCEMTCPENCTCYHDQSWAANVVDCSHAGYAGQLPSHVPMDATQLYLDGNELGALPSHAFLGRRRLRALHLNHSGVYALRNRTFNGLRALDTLRLDGNRLRTLRLNHLGQLPALRELYLQHNLLERLDGRALHGLHALRVLHLDHNRLVTLDPALMQLPSLAQLTLAMNPWTCACGPLKNMREWLRQARYVTDAAGLKCLRVVSGAVRVGHEAIADSLASNATSVEDYHDQDYTDEKEDEQEELTTAPSPLTAESPGYQIFVPENVTASCDGPDGPETPATPPRVADAAPTSRDGALVTRHRGTSAPGDTHLLALLLGTLGAFGAATAVALVAFAFRQEARVWLHSRFGWRVSKSCCCCCFCCNDKNHSDEQDDAERLYDAFISHSSKDEAWVAEQLLPELEERAGYRLCVRGRDLPPLGSGTPNSGSGVPTMMDASVARAVEASRRTVLVLSENMSRGEWTRPEFKTAHHAALRDRHRRLVIIALGDLQLKELEPDLRLHLKACAPLRWTDKLFWPRLRYALPDVPRGPRHRHHQRHHHQQHQLGRRTLAADPTAEPRSPPQALQHAQVLQQLHHLHNHHLHHHQTPGAPSQQQQQQQQQQGTAAAAVHI